MMTSGIKESIHVKNMAEFKEKVRRATELSAELEKATKEIESFEFEFEYVDNRETEEIVIKIIAQAITNNRNGIRDFLVRTASKPR